jgi:hypothetical protein
MYPHKSDCPTFLDPQEVGKEIFYQSITSERLHSQR